MSETKNYGLYLENDANVNFKVWREKLNGTNGSAMEKIDAALAGKADKSVSVHLTLTAEGWSEEAPYTQTLTVPGMTADSNGSISLDQSATVQQRQAAMYGELDVAGQTAETLAVAAYREKPSVDIPVVVTITG